MSKRAAKSPARAPPAPDAAAPRAPRWSRKRKAILAAAAIAALIAVAVIWRAQSRSAAPSDALRAAARYVGAAACAECHADETKAWRGSDHDLAMQEATDKAVLGDFKDAEFRHAGFWSRFFRRDGKFIVRTDGPEGALADYEIKYTFGVSPLQQYLVEFPGGRFQALGIAWDSRSKIEGGQRWFHIYANERIDHTDQLHWAGIYQNWNLQCAECHSTHLVKGYDAGSDTYKTTWNEINVACEACHGPGSRHVEWAKTARAPYAVADKGLAALQSRWKEAWQFADANAKIAQRDRPAADATMNVCAACHARRSTIAAREDPGAPLEDSHRLALLTPPNYHADGQQREEVYTWSSFLQTKMFQRGVTCMDCHEPHSLKLRAEGNELCVRCHRAAAFETKSHHFHEPGSKGAQCVECHMPAQNYMVIDARRDHGIRVPRPDLSAALSSPNACTQCHADRRPEWAAAAMDQWYGKSWRDRRQYGTTLHSPAVQGAKSLPSLLALAEDPSAPAIIRATAAELARPYLRPANFLAVSKLLASIDPGVRIAALGLLAAFEPEVRAQHGAPLLSDPVRGVRIEAARVLADIADDRFPPGQRAAREKAANELVASLAQDLDWPAANVTFGNLRMRQGRTDEAIASYERALALDPRFAGAYVNLADAHRSVGRDGESEKALRRGLAVLPRVADLHHALGLALVRKGDKAAALTELAAATRLAPDNARYTYVHAVALNSAGRRADALAILRAADASHPYDFDILSALVSLNREAGNAKEALVYARKISEVQPGDPAVKRLLSELEGAR